MFWYACAPCWLLGDDDVALSDVGGLFKTVLYGYRKPEAKVFSLLAKNKNKQNDVYQEELD